MYYTFILTCSDIEFSISSAVLYNYTPHSHVGYVLSGMGNTAVTILCGAKSAVVNVHVYTYCTNNKTVQFLMSSLTATTKLNGESLKR